MLIAWDFFLTLQLFMNIVHMAFLSKEQCYFQTFLMWILCISKGRISPFPHQPCSCGFSCLLCPLLAEDALELSPVKQSWIWILDPASCGMQSPIMLSLCATNTLWYRCWLTSCLWLFLGYLKVVIFVLEPVCQIVKEGLARSSRLPCSNISADLL